MPGGRHQIGTLAGFKSELVAGFVSECMAGFVGIRSPGKEQAAVHLKHRQLVSGKDSRGGPFLRQASPHGHDLRYRDLFRLAEHMEQDAEGHAYEHGVLQRDEQGGSVRYFV